jgi:arabinosyltransferase
LVCWLQVAIDNEVLAAMSNINYATPGGMLDTWMENVQRAGVKNAMVIALDAQTKANAEAKGITAHEMHIKVSTGSRLIHDSTQPTHICADAP